MKRGVLVARKNFDSRKTSHEQKNASSTGTTCLVAEKAPHICYSPLPSPEGEQRKHHSGRRYRVGGTSLITLPQAISLKAAIDFSASLGTPLVAHCTIHWVGTDAGDDPNGELFAKVRELLSLWLRRRGVPFTAVFAQAVRPRWNTVTFSSTCPTLGSKARSSSA